MATLIDIFKDTILVQEAVNIDSIKLLEDIQASYKTDGGFVEQSGYWRSPTYTKNTSGSLALLENQVSKFVTLYVESLGLDVKTEVDEYWAQVYKSGDYIEPHIHPASFCSAVYYLDVPSDTGAIKFVRPNKDVLSFVNVNFRPGQSLQTNQWMNIQPKSGMLIVFPSWISHTVEKVFCKGFRTIVAFNYKVSNSSHKHKWERFNSKPY